ncbi:T9SS type A sorting domain-containing protein [Taibaiella koreensis]|uniref:T9SS type A sorting domain-containing protein n=1 Tax=Taibaiella koreensis TaxID=1268548 RepID=UPI000E59F570|nr:T9SS type A sorting domain-containing protein [Taibaiella koreensis]
MKSGNLLCTALLLLAGAGSVQAQPKKCDMSITLMTPAEGAVINAYATFNITVKIDNIGPDDLAAGDTVWYNTPSMPYAQLKPFLLQQAILSGGSATLILATSTNVTNNPGDVTEPYCVRVVSNPSNTGTFIDTTVTNNNSSCNNVTFKALPASGINEADAAKTRLTLYPNPARNTVQIAWAGTAADRPVISLSDLSGRQLAVKGTGQALSGKEKLSLDISALQPGMYLVTIYNGGLRAAGRFIKQ